MSELFLQINTSLDGYIEDPRGSIDWMLDDTSNDAFHTATLQSIDGMIFGRKAHVLLAEFWPTAADAPDASPDLVEQTRLMNTLPKYVLTHGAERTGWTNSYAISASDVPRLKEAAERPIALFAGAATAQLLLEQGVVDEVRLIQYPIVLGGGTPLFAENGIRRKLTLTGGEDFPSGATLRRYRFA